MLSRARKALNAFTNRRSQQSLVSIAIACISIPWLGLIAYYAYTEAHNRVHAIHVQAANYARAVAEQLRDIASGTELLLETAAQTPAVRRGDAEESAALFQRMQERHSAYAYFTLARPDGTLLSSSTGATLASGINLSDRLHFQRVLKERRFSVGEYVVSRTTSAPVFPYAYPVLGSGQRPLGVLLAGIRLDRLEGYIGTLNLPAGSRLGVCDWQFRRLYRYPARDDRPLGAPLGTQLQSAVKASKTDHGTFVSKGPEVYNLAYGYSKLRLRPGEDTYLYVLAGIPLPTVWEVLSGQLGAVLAVAVFVSLGAIALLAVLNEWTFARGVRQMVEATGQAASKELPSRVGGDIAGAREHVELARSFDSMVDRLEHTLGALHQREGELTEANRELQAEVDKRKRLEHALRQSQQKFRRMAIHDGLTGLFNRRHFDLLAQQKIVHATRNKATLAFLMLDIDKFKDVNDTRGHAAGDAVLRALAALLQQSMRAVDLAGRYGGEEFVLVLPDTDTAGALHVAERLRADIASMRISLGQETLQVTASLGLAMLDCANLGGLTPQEATELALRQADAAMYAAKEAGRNCVRVG